MANTIKQKRGTGSNPDANDLEVGEIAIRTDNGHLFTKNDSGTVIEHADIGVLTANTLLGRRVSNGNPQELTAAQARTILNVADGATNVTNNNQLTNGAGYITSQRSVESVQDIVGDMVTGNSESGITVTYQDSDGTLDFSVSSQTDNNFTTALKNKLDGIAASATNVTNNNQLTNGAGYLTSSSSAITNKLPKAGGTITGNLQVNGTITGNGNIQLGDASSETVSFTAVVDSDIYPEIDSTHDLGNSFQKWDNVYANTFTGNAATSTKLATARTIAGTSFDGSANIDISYANLTNKPTIPTNNNQLTNGAGYVTSNTQLSNEQVQDIVGGMVSGNSESGITVTYQDSDGTLDFTVSSQTDNNFTNALKTKLDGIATGATNVTNNNQLTNGAGYVTSNTQLSNEQVQDIVGAMVTGNSESGISVTYQDSDGTLDFSVSSQTDNNFTNALKTKLDGIATGATNVTNNNQLTNGAGYVTANTQLSNEQVQDIVGAMVSGNTETNIAVTYDDTNGKLNFASTNTNTQLSNENVQDIVGAMVTGNTESGITVTYQDADGTLDFSVASQTDNNFTTALKNKLDGIATGANNITNNNQLTNGAGYITSQRSVESVQDIVGDMVTGNTESGITVTYQDADGTLDFSVASQTDQNFTTALKNKLDGIASSATNVTNNNQLTNGAGYITSSNAAITNKMPLAGGTFSGNVSFGDNNITNVGTIALDTIKGDADDNTNINFAGSDTINIKPAGTTRLAVNTSGVTVTGTLNAGTVKIGNQLIEKAEVIFAKLSADPDIDVDDGNVFFFGVGETANATPNITSTASNINSIMAVGDIMTVTVIAVSTGSGYYQDVTIDGSQPSFQRWLDDDEPTSASANGDFEVYTYTILKTANNLFTILANRSVFK